jgi:hypothetical protein
VLHRGLRYSVAHRLHQLVEVMGLVGVTLVKSKSGAVGGDEIQIGVRYEVPMLCLAFQEI